MKYSRRVIDWIEGAVFAHLALLIKVIFTINQVFYENLKYKIQWKGIWIEVTYKNKIKY